MHSSAAAAAAADVDICNLDHLARTAYTREMRAIITRARIYKSKKNKQRKYAMACENSRGG